MMFAFTSASIKLDKIINDSRGPPTIRIQGQPLTSLPAMITPSLMYTSLLHSINIHVPDHYFIPINTSRQKK